MKTLIAKVSSLILGLSVSASALAAATPSLEQRKADIALEEAIAKADKLSTIHNEALKKLNEARNAYANATKENKAQLKDAFEKASVEALKAERAWSAAHLEKTAKAAEKEKIEKKGSPEAGIATERALRYADLATAETDEEFSKRTLRDLGIAITAGLSYVPGQGKLVPNVLARYNFFQHRADVYRKAYLNNKTPGEADRITGEILSREDLWYWPTGYTAEMIPAVSLLAGFGLTDVNYRTKAGGTKPFIVGGSVGLMNAREASSAIHVDVGWMILESGNFKKDGQFFVGLSMDLLHARGMAKFFTGLAEAK